MERCNRTATKYADNGYRACEEHAQRIGSYQTFAEHPGPCDYPVDGHGAMRYDRRIALSRAAAKKG